MRRILVIAVAALSVTGLLTAYSLFLGDRATGDPYDPPTASADQVRAVAGARVFFAHQSVGVNILDGLADVYQAHGLPAPRTVQPGEAGPEDRLIEVRIGENGDGLGKIEAFDALLRDGLAEDLDVAILKLCYTDIREGEDVGRLFRAYTDTLTALEQDYPEVTFVAATVPLQVKRGPLGKVKAWLGKPDRLGPEHNTTREQFNALVRAEYAGTGHLFDVASIESTSPDGNRKAGKHDGELYYSLDKAYASDSGHLNATGAAAVAEGFVAAVAGAIDD